MHVQKVEIKAINGIRNLHLDFGEGDCSGWHVLIGDNGSGKTTVLRSIAMGMMGHPDYLALKGAGVSPNFEIPGEPEIRVELRFHSGNDEIIQLGTLSKWAQPASVDPRAITSMQSFISYRKDSNYGWRGNFWESKSESGKEEDYKAAQIFHGEYNGLFACGYGPYRRLSAGADHPNNQRANAFWTLFSEEAGLQQTTRWLEDLKLDSRSDPSRKETLSFVIEFINATGLLPNGARLTDHIDSNGIKLLDQEGAEIYFKEASDGYRSILSVALDMLKNMIACYGVDAVVSKAVGNVIVLPGVVLIDEVDAHLHPSWQIRIGKWFTDFFPKIQFIVTTHSPLICRGCAVNGRIWRLKPPGRRQDAEMVTGRWREQLVTAPLPEVYTKGAFGNS